MQVFCKIADSGDVAAWMREALHHAEADRISARPHHDRERAGGFLDR
jgi:hypothetical protein